MGRLFIPIMILLVIPVGSHADTDPDFQIRYLSADHIYINAGSADGLNVGDRVSVKRENKIVTELEVIYVSAHSASCEISGEDAALVAGDHIELDPKPSLSETSDSVRVENLKIPEPAKQNINSETKDD